MQFLKTVFIQAHALTKNLNGYKCSNMWDFKD